MAEQYYSGKLGIGDGERFQPTDEEIVGHYLYRKVMAGGGGNNNNNGLLNLSRREASRVPEADLYADEPWDIWSSFSSSSSSHPHAHTQDLYFYTRLQPRKAGGGNTSRRVGKGEGAWHGEDTGTEISLDMVVNVKRKGGGGGGGSSSSNTTRVTAVKKRFSYRNPKNPEENKRWILHEYSCKSVVDGCHVDGGDDGVADRSWVVCRLRKNPLVKRRRHYDDDNNNNNVFMASSSESLPSSSWNNDAELLQDQGTTSFPVQTKYGVSNVDRFGSGSGPNCNDDDDMTHQFLMDSLDLSDPPSWVDFFRQE